MSGWSVEQIPAQAGRTAVITGATSGIGYEAALALAGAGARVVLASRNAAKGTEMLARIRAAYPAAEVSFEPLDLASLASVEACAQRIAASTPRLDLLVNNAGVMAIPNRHETVDGFEMQLGANYFGHFALTLRLLPRILAASAPRVVTLSSLAHRSGRIDFDDLQSQQRYRPWTAYCQSKLATLIFALELERRARAARWSLMSNAAHPGFALTGLQSAGPRMGRDGPSMMELAGKLLGPFVAQSAAAGALPTLYAATSPEAEGGVLYGPDGFYEMKGSPRRAKIVEAALDRDAWQRLWAVSERLTGVSVAQPAAA
ncbi:SDR family oxidoreductase [Bosea sp. BK604]|uniref:SDR family oxidoreductase n=1 Tax=Bosea sp. BK604 TaxID=2512180 RepID=UPI0010470A32|nr:SDR family oxidoreductase [Bosea sp. BK604]TCR64063.1 NAD(P)-dependent dehydrogenase (short-subunit alcohol dehydrogenase family) [Bosea sp. BK604]